MVTPAGISYGKYITLSCVLAIEREKLFYLALRCLKASRLQRLFKPGKQLVPSFAGL
jgi:hypothetical protein